MFQFFVFYFPLFQFICWARLPTEIFLLIRLHDFVLRPKVNTFDPHAIFLCLHFFAPFSISSILHRTSTHLSCVTRSICNFFVSECPISTSKDFKKNIILSIISEDKISERWAILPFLKVAPCSTFWRSISPFLNEDAWEDAKSGGSYPNAIETFFAESEGIAFWIAFSAFALLCSRAFVSLSYETLASPNDTDDVANADQWWCKENRNYTYVCSMSTLP